MKENPTSRSFLPTFKLFFSTFKNSIFAFLEWYAEVSVRVVGIVHCICMYLIYLFLFPPQAYLNTDPETLKLLCGWGIVLCIISFVIYLGLKSASQAARPYFVKNKAPEIVQVIRTSHFEETGVETVIQSDGTKVKTFHRDATATSETVPYNPYGSPFLHINHANQIQSEN